MDQVWASLVWPPARTTPPATVLDAIRARYGAATMEFVAMQLEYPTERGRTDRDSAQAFNWPVAMPRF